MDEDAKPADNSQTLANSTQGHDPPFIDIEVVTGLQPTPAPLALDPEVEELIARINSRNNQLRQDALTIAQQWVDDGNDLIAIKQQVGHGPFGEIVIRQFPFSLRSAEHRMRIARAIAAGTIKIETVANLGLTAAIASLSTIDPLARQQRKLRGAFRTFVSKERQSKFIQEWDNAEQEVIKQHGPFETMEWPEPNIVGETLVVEWNTLVERVGTGRRNVRQLAYIWKVDADQYYIIVLQYDHHQCWATASSNLAFWERVLPWLREHASATGSGGRYWLLVRDPSRCTMLHHFSQLARLEVSNEPLI